MLPWIRPATALLLGLLLHLSGSADAAPVREVKKKSRCPDACTMRGTCDESRGVCLCPLGWGGADCSIDATPACQLTKDYRVPCTTHLAMTCACRNQCEAQLVMPLDSKTPCFLWDPTQGGPPAEDNDAVLDRLYYSTQAIRRVAQDSSCLAPGGTLAAGGRMLLASSEQMQARDMIAPATSRPLLSTVASQAQGPWHTGPPPRAVQDRTGSIGKWAKAAASTQAQAQAPRDNGSGGMIEPSSGIRAPAVTGQKPAPVDGGPRPKPPGHPSPSPSSSSSSLAPSPQQVASQRFQRHHVTRQCMELVPIGNSNVAVTEDGTVVGDAPDTVLSPATPKLLSSLPPSRCPNHCHWHGYCEPTGKAEGRCTCFIGWAGRDCRDPDPNVWCPSNCQGPTHGACEGGFCRCNLGFFGMDCSLTLAKKGADMVQRSGPRGVPPGMYLQPRLYWEEDAAAAAMGKDEAGGGMDASGGGATAAAPKVSPSIYVYDLPPVFTTWRTQARGSKDLPTDFSRKGNLYWTERLLSSAHRVSDASRADYFFLPILGSRYTNNRTAAMEWAANDAPTAHLWVGVFDNGKAPGGKPARGGKQQAAPIAPPLAPRGGDEARHLIVLLDDVGVLPYWGGTRREILARIRSKLIVLQHFGLYEIDPKNKKGRGDVEGLGAPFRPGQDVLIPPENDMGALQARSPLVAGVPTLERNLTLFFSGAVYPEGPHARTLIFNHWGWGKTPPGWILIDTNTQGSDKLYWRHYASSVFCLGVEGKGGGWGRRTSLSMLMGCIPVIIEEKQSLPFDEVWAWDRFALRLSYSQIPNLKAILDGIPHFKVAAMQRELACVAPMMTWSSFWGALPFKPTGAGEGHAGGPAPKAEPFDRDAFDAFSMTMEVLRRRLQSPLAPADTRLARAGSAAPAVHASMLERSACSVAPTSPLRKKTPRVTAPGAAPGSEAGGTMCIMSSRNNKKGSRDGQGRELCVMGPAGFPVRTAACHGIEPPC